jgi:hypothetical protein
VVVVPAWVDIWQPERRKILARLLRRGRRPGVASRGRVPPLHRFPDPFDHGNMHRPVRLLGVCHVHGQVPPTFRLCG